MRTLWRGVRRLAWLGVAAIGACALVASCAIFVAMAGSVVLHGHRNFLPAASRLNFAYPAPRPGVGSFTALANKSSVELERVFYNGNGEWHMCVPVICNTKNRDWGADNLTYTLYLRWLFDRDRKARAELAQLGQGAVAWTPNMFGSSDEMMWDAVAELREYQVTRNQTFLIKAETAMARVNAPASGFATGACPTVNYQWASGNRDHGTKTLETDANYIKAALLLYQITHQGAYLAEAEAKYADVRRYFLAPNTPMYTVFLIDNGQTCQPIAGQFLGSVNGIMIWDGAVLARVTRQRSYLGQALATARAVVAHLRDSAGIYTGLLDDIDVNEPLVEAMYYLAHVDGARFARLWLLSTASAASAGMNAAGEFGRYFDGPAPTGEVNAWQLNGGISLMLVAAALDPAARPADPGYWGHAVYVKDVRTLAGPELRISFTGRAIAIYGTLGDICCQPGHAQVAIDGAPTFSRIGIQENKTSSSRRLLDQVLFAWRWPDAGRHVVTILPGSYDVLEGGSFFQMTGYLVVR